MMRSVILVALLVLSGCGTSQKGALDVLIVASGADAVSLDPFRSNDSASSQIRGNIFDRLIERDEDGGYVPSLATEWKYINPTTLELKLREGVMFQNGEPFGAKDVKFSVERALASPEVQHIVGPIKAVEIVDEYTVRVLLKAPFAPLLAHLAHSAISIMNEKAVVDAGSEVGQKPVGTGPFVLESWNHGQSVILARNTNYWGEPAKLSKVEVRIVPEAAARTIALETGDVDVVYTLDPVDRERINNTSSLTLAEDQAPRMEYISFNIGRGKNPIWKDARVRKAFALSLDVPGIINSVLFNSADPASSMLQKSVFGAVEFPLVQQNIAEAKALLAEAGIAEGTKLILWTPQGAREKIMQVVQNNLKEIGLDASIEVLEWGRYLDATAKGEHDVFILGWTTITLDGDYGMYNLLHSSAAGGAGNRSFSSNPEMDRLLAAARVELDQEKRREMYRSAQEIVHNDHIVIPLYYPYETVALKKSVKNFGFKKTSDHRFNATYKE
ncbi:MAG: ABC transporter substrate-binding protein [Brevinema sp.]